MNHIEAMKQALEALELHGKQYPHMQKGYTVDAITALRTAIAEAEKQEPVCTAAMLDDRFLAKSGLDPNTPLYTVLPEATAQRQPLTDEQICSMCKQTWVFETVRQWVRAIEASHGIRGEET